MNQTTVYYRRAILGNGGDIKIEKHLATEQNPIHIAAYGVTLCFGHQSSQLVPWSNIEKIEHFTSGGKYPLSVSDTWPRPGLKD